MIDDTLKQLKSKIFNSVKIDNSTKDELADLVTTLSTQLETIRSSHPDDAQSIADFANVSTGESVRSENDKELHNISLKGLERSIKKFEISHPDLTGAVNVFMQKLADLGI